MVSLPPGKKVIGSKWVYRIKYKFDGTVERYKARLVVLGNNQREGLDFTETFSPVTKMNTVRTLLAIAAAKKWELHHGDLHEEVYMKLLPGFSPRNQHVVFKLQKSLYGLRQAPRCWFTKLVAALKNYGFVQSHFDYSLFVWRNGDVQLSVLVYVDDLILGGNNAHAVTDLKSYLERCFHMKDLGALKYFLEIEVSRGDDGIYLCQRK